MRKLKVYTARFEAYGRTRVVNVKAFNKKEVREIVNWEHGAERIFEIGLNPYS